MLQFECRSFVYSLDISSYDLYLTDKSNEKNARSVEMQLIYAKYR